MDLKWSKMLSNLLVNSTCAILDMTPQEVLRSKDLFHIEMRLFKEALDVMKEQGISPINLPRVPMQTLAWIVRLLPEEILQPLLYKPLGGGRGGKMPSLHIDLHHGRKDSEVVVLNGAVSRFGHANHVQTPVNEALTETLLMLASSPELQEKFSHNPIALIDAIRKKDTSYAE
jgi:2-dehydropantoate 2-reductase